MKHTTTLLLVITFSLPSFGIGIDAWSQEIIAPIPTSKSSRSLLQNRAVELREQIKQIEVGAANARAKGAPADLEKNQLLEQFSKELKHIEAKLEDMKRDLVVFHLRHVEVEEAAQLLGTIIQGMELSDVRVASDKRLNRLLLFAPKGERDRLRDVINAIDVAQPEPSKETRVFQFPMTSKFSDVQTLMNAVADTGAKVLRVQANGDTATVEVVANSPDQLNKVEAMKAELQRPTPPVARMISIVWLSNQIGKDIEEAPDKIQKVATALAKQGTKDLKVAANLSVSTVGKFKTNCKTANGVALSANGAFYSDSNSLDISIKVTEGPDQSEVLDIDTELQAPLGHPVVLGLSPSSLGDSAFVVTIE